MVWYGPGRVFWAVFEERSAVLAAHYGVSLLSLVLFCTIVRNALRHLWFKQSLVGWTFFHPPPVVNKIPL